MHVFWRSTKRYFALPVKQVFLKIILLFEVEGQELFLDSILFLLEKNLDLLNINYNDQDSVHRKKSFSIFPSPAGMSLTKLSLGGNNLYMK